MALEAKVEAPAARGRSGECGEVVQLGWNGLGSAVEVFEVSGQVGCKGVCGGFLGLLGVWG